MIEGDITRVIRQIVTGISYDSENGIVLTFADGTIVHVWGGISRSYDVNITVTSPK